jgi:hypothetical protein
MYLVHLHLRPTDDSPFRALPDRIGTGLRAAARAEDGVEHVVVHGDARPYPVLGVYVVADRLEDAEANAARVWERALTAYPELGRWGMVEARTPLIASFYEEGSTRGSPAPPRSRAENGQDRFRPQEPPSRPDDRQGW